MTETEAVKYLLTETSNHGTIKEYQECNRNEQLYNLRRLHNMKLEEAVDLLQDGTFYMEETLWSNLCGDVSAKYAVTVVDPETLLEDIDIDLDKVTDEDDLNCQVEDGLYNITDVGSDGVEAQ